MRLRPILRLAAAILLFAACQSDSFKIEGTAEGFADGDTIHLTTDPQEGKPLMSTVVKGSRFEFTGQADSMMMCFIYSAKDMSVAQAFFLEPATIKVKLSPVAGASRVSGTRVNDALQTLNDSAFVFQKEIEQLYALMGQEPGVTPTEEQDKQLESAIQESYAKLTRHIYETARKKKAVIPVIPIVETVRHLKDETSVTVPRNDYRLVQTPQTFDIQLLKAANRQPYNDGFTDDASVVEAFGFDITLVDGNRENIKITTPYDITVAEAIIQHPSSNTQHPSLNTQPPTPNPHHP